MGLFPAWEAVFLRSLLVFDKVPTIVLLPILFCVLGTGEALKVAIILLGLFPKIALDAYLRCKSTPPERIHKALTMGATGLELAMRVVLPQHLPRLLDTIRLNLGPAVAYLFVSESLGSTEGLGYRIFLFQKNVNMAGIIVYAAWATLLMFVADLAFRLWVRLRYKWLDKE
jgi:NitT/TauT family transport system permease protein